MSCNVVPQMWTPSPLSKLPQRVTKARASHQLLSCSRPLQLSPLKLREQSIVSPSGKTFSRNSHAPVGCTQLVFQSCSKYIFCSLREWKSDKKCCSCFFEKGGYCNGSAVFLFFFYWEHTGADWELTGISATFARINNMAKQQNRSMCCKINVIKCLLN